MATTTSTKELIPQADLDRMSALIKQSLDLKKLLLEIAEIPTNKPNPPTPPKSSSSGMPTNAEAAEKEALRIAKEIQKVEAQIQSILQGRTAILVGAQTERNRELVLARAIAKEEAAAEGSLERMQKRLSRLYIEQSRINKETAAGQKLYDNMGAEITELVGKVSQLEQGRGNFGRNVGNYASGLSALQFQLQTLFREVPSAQSPQQFFQAISNNLPMFSDSLKKATDEYNAFKKALAEGKDVEKVDKPIKQLIKSVFSWQTAIVVATMLLVKYGDDVLKWAGNLIKGGKAVDEAAEKQKLYNEIVADGTKKAGSEIAKLELLYEASQDVSRSMEERKAAVDEMQRLYPKTLENIDDEAILSGKAADAYDDLRDSIIKKAIAQAAADKIAEIELKRFEELQKREEKLRKLNEDPKGSGFTGFLVGGAVAGGGPNAADLEAAGITKETIAADRQAAAIARQEKAIDKINEKYDKQVDAIKEVIDVRDLLGDLDKGSGGSRLKSLDAELKAEEALSTSQIDVRMATIKRTLDLNQEMSSELIKNADGTYNDLYLLDKTSVEDRMGLTVEYYDLEKKRIEALGKAQEESIVRRYMAEKDVTEDAARASEAVQNQLLALSLATNAKLIESAHNRVNAIRNEEDRAIQHAISGAERRIAAENRDIDKNESNELTTLADEYSKGLMLSEEYERQKLEITRKYADQREQVGLNLLKEQLALLESDKNQTIEQQESIKVLKDKINAAEVDANKRKNDQIIEDDEKLKENREAAIKSILGSIGDMFQALADGVGIATEKALADLDKQKEAAQEAAEEEQDRIERLAEHGGITEEQKNARIALSKEQLREKEKEIEKQQIEAKQRQAKYDKAAAIAQALISGGLAIAATLATPGFAGTPWGIAAAILAGSMVAAQVGIISAQPLPEYAEGTDFHPGGPAIWGDAGKSELGIWGGRMYKSPAVPTLVDMPRGAVVLPDYNKAMADLALAPLPVFQNRMPSDMPRVEVTPYDDRAVLDKLSQSNRTQAMRLASFEREKKNRRFDEFKRRANSRIIN